jgi:hypothetical protein
MTLINLAHSTDADHAVDLIDAVKARAGGNAMTD